MSKNQLLVIILLFIAFQTQAQFIKNKALDFNIGFGYSFPYDDVNIEGDGFYLHGEYVLTVSNWVDFRPYAGLIFTTASDDPNKKPFETTANSLLIGGKTRITAPIPYVAPYFEIGIGASIGNFKTVTPFTYINDSGVFVTIPFSVGLELGKKHNFDIAFSYYFINSVQQFIGGATIGFSIPLDD